MASSAVEHSTVEDFFALEETSEARHACFAGEIFPMAGESFSHGTSSANAVRSSGNALADRGCVVLPSHVMVFCPNGLRTYPDVSVVCDRPRVENDHELTLMNPPR